MQKALFLLMLVGVAAGGQPPPVAHAHAFPDHSEPRVGSKVKTPPTTVRIWFDGHLEPAFSTIRVYDEDQKKVDQEDGRVSPSGPTLLEVSLNPLPSGRYRVVWAVVALDGHRTEGDFWFTIEALP